MKKMALMGIIFLGLLLRLVVLSRFPVGFTPDEASFGYDAYSLISTGKDQWGNGLPLILKSFGDFKAPIYSYLAVPFVALFGLTKEAVRLPNVILGVGAIVTTYFLVRRALDQKTALASAFLLAISPWHIMMSRGAFEANLTTFFLTFGIYLLFSKKLVLAAIILGLNLFTYHSAKVVTPLVVFVSLFIFRERLVKINKKILFVSAMVFLFFLALTFSTLLTGAATRAKDVSIFNGTVEEGFNIRQKAIAAGENSVLAKILHNKFSVSVQRFAGNYVSYLSPTFLFVRGPAEFTYGMIPGQGVLYLFELPFLILFVISFVKSKERKFYYFILAWILIAPIPAALATGAGYAGNRSVIMLPALSMALAIGLNEGRKLLKNKYLIGGYIAFLLLCFGMFFESYFVVSPAVAAKSMLYGNLEAAMWLTENVDRNTSIVVDKALSEPHIYIAFANRWDPGEYQMATKNWNFEERGLGWVDQLPEYKLGNYTFKSVHQAEYNSIPGVILVGKPEVFNSSANIVKTIYYPDGQIAVVIVKS